MMPKIKELNLLRIFLWQLPEKAAMFSYNEKLKGKERESTSVSPFK